jgi:type IV pilus assembly protein PilN
MIKINLLPYREIIRKENIITHAVIAGFFAGVVLIVIVSVDYAMRSRINWHKKEIARIEKEIKKNEVSLNEIKKLKQEKETYRKQFQVIENLKKEKEGPVRILDEIASKIPKEIWLVTLKQSGNNLQLTGVAVENKLISQFMSRLKASSYFQKVDLITSEMKVHKIGKGTSLKLKKFTITCLITSPSQG